MALVVVAAASFADQSSDQPVTHSSPASAISVVRTMNAAVRNTKAQRCLRHAAGSTL